MYKYKHPLYNFMPSTYLICLYWLKKILLSSSIINIPGESTLRRDFLRLQLANKERSEAQRRQQLEQQQNEEHKRLLLAERQKRIEEQKEQRRRLEEVIGFRLKRENVLVVQLKFCTLLQLFAIYLAVNSSS